MIKNINNWLFRYNIFCCIHFISFWLAIVFFISLLCQIYLSGVLYCDSIDDTITTVRDTDHLDSVEANSDNSLMNPINHPPGVWLTVRCKLYWYFSAKSSGKFNSYFEFKQSWNPNISLRKELKLEFKRMCKDPLADLNRTSEKASRDFAKSRAADAAYSQYLGIHKRAVEAQRWQSTRSYYNDLNQRKN
jgi:hypothetical protein